MSRIDASDFPTRLDDNGACVWSGGYERSFPKQSGRNPGPPGHELLKNSLVDVSLVEEEEILDALLDEVLEVSGDDDAAHLDVTLDGFLHIIPRDCESVITRDHDQQQSCWEAVQHRAPDERESLPQRGLSCGDLWFLSAVHVVSRCWSFAEARVGFFRR